MFCCGLQSLLLQTVHCCFSEGQEESSRAMRGEGGEGSDGGNGRVGELSGERSAALVRLHKLRGWFTRT